MFFPLRLRRVFCDLLFCGVGILVGSSIGLLPLELNAQVVETHSSFTDKNELAGAKSVIAEAVSETENLLKQNLVLQEQVQSLNEALIETKAVAETTVAENHELNARIEALGISAVGTDRIKLEQRLIKAVSDLDRSRTEVAQTREILAGLSESVLTLLKLSSDVPPESRLILEEQLRAANQKLGTSEEPVERAEPTGVGLTSARVVSFKPDLGLLVGNIGAREGVKIGMPFRVFDGQKNIALARVVDVRTTIFGALIQETLSDNNPVKVGHRLKVAAD